ncbi:MAG: MBL fold metallo-hydrolase [bacterium]|nr:MBL fold metallo-hydrolase [bacterium]
MKKNSFIIHQLKGHIEYVFLAEYPDKILVLDGGCRDDARLIEEFVTQKLNRHMSNIRLSIISHMHPDHAAGAQLLRSRFNIPIASYHTIDRWYSGFRGRIQHFTDTFFSQVAARLMRQPLKRMWYGHQLNPEIILFEGDQLPLFPDWEVVHTPGHTNHDIALLNRECATLYAGDIIIKIRKRFLLPYPIIFPHLMEESLMKLSQMDIHRLLMAHGGIYEGDDISPVFVSLVRVIHRKLRFLFKLADPFTRFSPEVGKETRKNKKISDR